ncbi:MAG TPA: TatD family hydrolase [Patescibacteria group bacterium]|nr:TatD family hydrolase [Patescibacteria group bacterium]
MNLRLIDTHCHLHFPPYVSDLADVLSRMKEKEVGAITIGTSVKNSKEAIAFVEAHENIWAAVAFHPEHVSSAYHDPNEGSVESVFDLEALNALARSSKKIVAIGETGLDYHYFREEDDVSALKGEQKKVFRAQVHLAQELGLPLSIHSRDANEDVLTILKEETHSDHGIRGVMHSFSGTWEEAQACLDLGLLISVNGIATFPPKKSLPPERDIHQTISRIPLDRLLVETDAPYLAPVPFRGKRNEPVFVEEVAKHVAQVRGKSLEEIARITTENAIRLFGLE